jgi:hypothetical protein
MIEGRPKFNARPRAGMENRRGLMRRGLSFRLFLAVLVICPFFTVNAAAGQEKIRITFRVKFVSADAVYLEGGSNAGLAVGQRLTVKRKAGEGETEDGKDVADIEIDSVASTSAAARVMDSSAEIAPGDVAYLSSTDVEKLKILQSTQEIRKYPQIVSFTEGDPLDEEVRESLPRPPLPEINRTRGRIGFDYGGLQQPGGVGFQQVGFVLKLDATRLGGSYWNLSGYYRGRIQSQNGAAQQPTLTDLISRTYHLFASYNNPESRWVAAGGRLYIPWATSLSTIDGGYLGRRYGKATVGVFGGTSPDPTTWNYAHNRQIGGGFVNFEGGSFDALRYTSTTGFTITRLNWHPDRQFAFFENGIFYKRYLSVYSDVEVDLLRAGLSAAPVPQASSQSGVKLSRSFLIGTGLLDKYLFQGLSAGFRLELPYRFGVYSSVGRGNRTGDAKSSWDYMVGGSASNILKSGIRADLRYSKFDSSFGSGNYASLTLSRFLGEDWRFDVQAGQQNIISAVTSQSRSRFLTGDADWFFSRRLFLGFGLTFYRGPTQDYNQWFITLGFRFDNRGNRKS